MRNIFKRRRPVAKAQQMSRGEIQELLILRWHGHTPDEWDALPAIVKVDKREAYFKAWGLAG